MNILRKPFRGQLSPQSLPFGQLVNPGADGRELKPEADKIQHTGNVRFSYSRSDLSYHDLR